MNEGLKSLKRIALKDFIFNDDSSLCDIKIIKEYLEAFEIIKDKQVNIFMIMFTECTLEQYNDLINPKWRQLTQEEYNSLKEVIYGKERK